MEHSEEGDHQENATEDDIVQCSDVNHMEDGSPSHNIPESKYASFYKSSKVFGDQVQRREQFLELQKQRRTEVVDEKRDLTELLLSDDEESVFDDQELMIVENIQAPKRRIRNVYRNRLMLSEWFTQIPNDLETDWLIKLCPAGQRRLVVACKGITKSFTASGKMKAKFKSTLPGGNHASEIVKSSCYTILDCIYNRKIKTFFVFDVIAWSGAPQKYYPAEHRFFWVKSKLDETPLKEINSMNQFSFVEIESFPAELNVIEDKLSRPFTINDSPEIPLQGILFYHKEGLYQSGCNPLVGWLKIFMVPEMLQIPVHSCFKTPNDYTTLEEYLKRKIKLPKRGSSPQTVECVNMEEIS